MALAGALAFGVSTVAKADDAAAAPAAPTFSLVAQELGAQTFGTWNGTSTKTTSNVTNGDTLNMSLEHVQAGASFGIDSLDTVALKTELNSGALSLLEAYDTHSLADLNAGLAVQAGQFRLPFGANAYANPDQLIRTGYSAIDSLIPSGKASSGNTTPTGLFGGTQFDLGVELTQTYSDLTIQVAAVQDPSAKAYAPGGGTGNNGTQFDYVGRAQWKSSNVALGVSDYYQAVATGPTSGVNNNNLNTFGANASVNVDVFALDLEAIFGSGNTNGYTATLSAKPVSGFQAAAWYEFTTDNFAPASGVNGVLSNDLGAGVNFWLASKTRLALDVDFTGYNGTTAAADLLATNVESVQLTESF